MALLWTRAAIAGPDPADCPFLWVDCDTGAQVLGSDGAHTFELAPRSMARRELCIGQEPIRLSVAERLWLSSLDVDYLLIVQ